MEDTQPDKELQPSHTLRRSLGVGLLVLGFGTSVIAGLDPARLWFAWLSWPLCLLGIAACGDLLHGWRPRQQLLRMTAVLSLVFATTAPIAPEYRADWAAYYGYLRSAVFDGDWDFENDWQALGERTDIRTSIGRVSNPMSVGPALIWSPMYLVAHAYVKLDRAFGVERYEADGFSNPYRRSTRLATLTVVTLGTWLLAQALTGLFGAKLAWLASLAGLFASTAIYYAVILPSVSHGVTFGLASCFCWAWLRAERNPNLISWLFLGSFLGLLILSRWQGLVYVLMVVPLAIWQWRKKRAELSWIVVAAAASLVAFSPQLLAWKSLYGSWITIPQGRGFVGSDSPHWLETLISANHGLFNWTPITLFGVLGLVLGLRRHPLFCITALAVFSATTWINGAVPGHDWAAGDAFGARRFTLVIPLLAFGLARSFQWLAGLVEKRPLLVPGVVVVMAVAWQSGLISLVRARKYRTSAPIASVAEDQVRSTQRAADRIVGAFAGDEGRAIIYEIFSAEYFYSEFNRSGTISLYAADERYLLEGWSTRSRRTAKTTFRRALAPRACVRIPLSEPFELRVAVTARKPSELSEQRMAVRMNAHPQGSFRLANDWSEKRFVVPKDHLVRGVNKLCLEFAGPMGAPGDTPQSSLTAAEVALIQLP